MKKFGLFLFWFLLFLAIGIGALYYFSPNIIAQMLQSKLGVEVNIKNLRVEHDRFFIEGLTVGNPRESKLKNALQVDNIQIEAPYGNYFDNPIIIRDLSLKDIDLGIEFYTKDYKSGNWLVILDNLKQTKEPILSIERTTIIRKLYLLNITIDLLMPGAPIKQLSPIDRLAYVDINTDEGIPIQEITEAIVQHMIGSVFFMRGIKALVELPANILKSVFSPFSIFSGSKSGS